MLTFNTRGKKCSTAEEHACIDEAARVAAQIQDEGRDAFCLQRSDGGRCVMRGVGAKGLDRHVAYQSTIRPTRHHTIVRAPLKTQPSLPCIVSAHSVAVSTLSQCSLAISRSVFLIHNLFRDPFDSLHSRAAVNRLSGTLR